MSGEIRNHTTFIGNAYTISRIAGAIDRKERIFAFDELHPMPQVFYYCEPRATLISADKFTNTYHLPCPETIEDYIIFAKEYLDSDDSTGEIPDTLPLSIHNQITHKYNCADWRDWRDTNWGVRWPGYDVAIMYRSENLLVVTYDTLDATPNTLFDHLLGQHPDLRIIHGYRPHYEDDIQVTYGNEKAFYAYYQIKRKSFVKKITPPPLGNDKAEEPYLILGERVSTKANKKAINTLLADGCLVDPEGNIDDIEHIIASRRETVE